MAAGMALRPAPLWLLVLGTVALRESGAAFSQAKSMEKPDSLNNQVIYLTTATIHLTGKKICKMEEKTHSTNVLLSNKNMGSIMVRSRGLPTLFSLGFGGPALLDAEPGSARMNPMNDPENDL